MRSISGVSTPQPLQLKNNSNGNDAYDRQIKKLNEVKSKLEEQKSKLSQDKNVDEKIRKERLKELAEQTQAIDAQINQLKIDKMKDKQEAKSEQKEKTDASRSSDSKTMEQIAQDHLTIDSIKNMRKTKIRIENEAKSLKNDIRIDTLRIELGPREDKDKAVLLENAEETVFKPKREEISELNGKAGKINKKIGELYTRMRKTENTDHQASGASEDQKSQAVEQGEQREEEQARSSDSAVKSIDIKA